MAIKFKDFLLKFNNIDQILDLYLDRKERSLDIYLLLSAPFELDKLKTFYEELNKEYVNSMLLAVNVFFEIPKDKYQTHMMLDYFSFVINNLRGRFLAFNSFKTEYQNYTFTTFVDKDSKHLEGYLPQLKDYFMTYGFKELKFNVEISDDIKETSQLILEQKATNQVKNTVILDDKEKKDVNIGRFKYSRNIKDDPVSIKEIPVTQLDLERYENTHGFPSFVIEGEIFECEIKKLTNFHLATFKVTDQTDSIVVKRFLRKQEEIDEIAKLKNGDVIKVSGKAQFDNFLKDMVLMADVINYVKKASKKENVDLALEKRIELHCHTKMSNMDGICDASDYIKQAVKWGHKAIAFTDHSGVYAFPEINKTCKGLDIKPIYGLESSFVREEDFKIAFTEESINLRNATYVVFDLETTGFSVERDKIIEIACHKIHQGQTIAKFETFINPERKLSELTKELTSITDEDVNKAPKIEEKMQEFLDFIDGCILVAHNASFDMAHIYENMRRLKIEKTFPVIDTLQLARSFYYKELKRFNLKACAKFFKVKQDHHHRATDDTRVTAEVFMHMLNDLFKRGIYDYKDINNSYDKEESWKHVIPSHINLLVKNQTGLKNLYKIVSDSLTVHFYGEGRLLKSVLDKYREGILVGSGCVNGEIFETALNKSQSELENRMDLYDYIEVQPPTAYMQLYKGIENGHEVVLEVIKKIIMTAKRLKKIVVATSDCHYLNKEDKKYRDIYIKTPQIGGGMHSLAYYKESPHQHFRTTTEMLEEFSFLNPDLAYEIVVTNTNLIADMIEKIKVFPDQLFTPKDDAFKDILGVASIEKTLKEMVYNKAHAWYGNPLPQLVSDRLNKELNSIINNGFSSNYYISHLIVKKSLDDDYLVGSRGSVGSSFVATMMDITEVNPLPPHYRCPKCQFTSFKLNEELKQRYGIKENEKAVQINLEKVESGYDLDDALCPVCQAKLIKDGHDIPFETFLGFDGDKVPDIDLNFSGEYQPVVHEYIRSIMGNENAFRSGTIATVAEKNAFGYVKGYLEKQGITLRNAEVERLAKKIEGTKRSTGQHPGGIIVVPDYVEIYDVTPIQYPADDTSNSWRTTHFDYHSFEDNLLKLDILGHDDPTLIKFLMDYVYKHPSEFPFSRPQDIPIDDKNVYRLFCGTEVIKVTKDDIFSEVASYAVPEFGTNFTRQMLTDTKPKTFAELVKISGLSHGTDVWLNNAQSLVLGKTPFGKIDFNEVIGCRDDIMVYLLYQGLEPIRAFKIMEFVRKGLPSKKPEDWEKHKEYMRQMKVPEWYIWSCEQIKYMFPKAHATAYVLMALRIAWFKVYKPVLFYSAYFSKRAEQFEVDVLVNGINAIKNRLIELQNKKDITKKEEDLITCFNVALEMNARGLKFLQVDINRSQATEFVIESETELRIPFSAIDGLGESVAIDIVEKRNEKAFTSKEDLQRRTKVNKTVFEKMTMLGALDSLKDESEIEDFGLFAL